MGRTRRDAAAVAAGLVLLLAGCDGAEDGQRAAPSTVPLPRPVTTERQVSGGGATTTSVAPPAPTTTAPPEGLPADLGIPGAGNLALGAGSSFSNGLTVRGVPLLEVVAFVERELVALGWAVEPAAAPAPGQALLVFVGTGATGQALVAPEPDGAVGISLFLRGG